MTRPPHTRIFQKRFDDAIESLQLTFVDLVLLTESLDQRVQELERTVTQQGAHLKVQGEQITRLVLQVAELTARLDGRQ